MVLAKIDRTDNFEDAYEKGERNPELVLGYIKALNTAGESSLKVANDYLDESKDLSEENQFENIV
ncbi:MAG: hypothetical protein R2769_14555 [Saprospiraceae bacterium]